MTTTLFIVKNIPIEYMHKIIDLLHIMQIKHFEQIALMALLKLTLRF
jgi:hypothetical protein